MAGNGQAGRKAWKREGRGIEQRAWGRVEGKEARENKRKEETNVGVRRELF